MTHWAQAAPILQSCLPVTPWDDPALSRMPGLMPVAGNWIIVDDAYAAQMAEKARLCAGRRSSVMTARSGAQAVQAELLEHVLDTLPPDFERSGDHIDCPDGRRVGLDADPFDVLSRLLQEDLLILQKVADEHVLTAGLLCFPASWTLVEKIGRPLAHIHGPVPIYDARMAARVQTIFNRVPAGRAMWRMNVLGYADATLHQPRPEAAPRDATAPPRFLRCERQTMFRLPRTGAMIFAVHTWVVRPDRLTAAQRATCPVTFAV